MNTITPSVSLQENLNRHCDSLQLLIDLLQQEHEALQVEDAELLERITQSKAQAATHLNALARELPPVASVARSEPALWAKLQSLAAQCQQANRNNALLLDLRTRAVRGRLDVLRSAYNPNAQQSTVYGRSGLRQDLGSRRFGFA